jgi:hypothetical protein
LNRLSEYILIMSESNGGCCNSKIFVKIWKDWYTEYFQIQNFFRHCGFRCYILYIMPIVLSNYPKQNSNAKSKKTIELCNNMLVRFLDSGHPANQELLDYASVCNWQEALIELKKLMPNHEEKASPLNLEKLYSDLKSMDKDQMRQRIVKYRYSCKLYRIIKSKIQDDNPKVLPFYTAISQGLPDSILEAFIEAGHNINELSSNFDLISSGLCLASKFGRFKIASLILKKIIKESEMSPYIDEMDKYPFEYSEIIKSIPTKLPSFKTFEDRLDFACYLQYSMKAVKLKLCLDTPTHKILQWYQKYQIARFAVIIGKSTELPQLDRNVLYYISLYL